LNQNLQIHFHQEWQQNRPQVHLLVILSHCHISLTLTLVTNHFSVFLNLVGTSGTAIAMYNSRGKKQKNLKTYTAEFYYISSSNTMNPAWNLYLLETNNYKYCKTNPFRKVILILTTKKSS
jgi:hypothetical protein